MNLKGLMKKSDWSGDRPWLQWLWVWVVLIWGLFWVGVAPVAALTVQDVPNPRQTGGEWVTDLAGLISPETEVKLNQLLTQLEAQTTVEMAVVTVPQTSPASTPKAFATELFNTWGIGKADQNNGILFLVSQGDRQVEIETGIGMAEQLPDARVESIIQTYILPAFQQEDYDWGIWQGTQAIASVFIAVNPVEEMLPLIRPIYRGLLGLGVVLLITGIGWSIRVLSKPLLLPKTGKKMVYTGTGDYSRSLFQKGSLVSLARRCGFQRAWSTLPFRMAIAGFALIVVGGMVEYLIGVDSLYALNFRNLSFTLALIAGIPLIVRFPLRSQWLKYPWFEEGMTLLLSLSAYWIAFFLAFTSLLISVGILLIIPGIIFLVTSIGAWFLVDSIKDIWFCQARCLCEQCKQPIQVLNSEQVQPALISPEEISVRLKTALYRGWQCLSCSPTLDRESIYLVQGIGSSDFVCEECKEPTLSFQRQGDQQHSYCNHCGDHKEQAIALASSGSPSSYSSSQSSYDYTDSSSNWSSSSSSDFGGGSSDGGGAGGSW